ncbi:MAG TPA: hypothetical protein VLK82_17000 [Candidatus Tectomicrobia bacterium]|nr:hypothetical protein [Candidatus Tectomicrobia bacterium]
MVCVFVQPVIVGDLYAMGTKLKRKSFFVDESILRQAKKALGVKTDAEAVRLALERIAEMEEFWKFMQKSRQTLKPGSLEKPARCYPAGRPGRCAVAGFRMHWAILDANMYIGHWA